MVYGANLLAGAALGFKVLGGVAAIKVTRCSSGQYDKDTVHATVKPMVKLQNQQVVWMLGKNMLLKNLHNFE